MFTQTEAWRMRDERGPRWAVYGQIRPNEARVRYALTAERAEQVRQEFVDEWRYYGVTVYPPEGAIDLSKLGRERQEAKALLDERTEILKAGVLRALEENRAEAEVAREAGVDRMTVRAWAGKR